MHGKSGTTSLTELAIQDILTHNNYMESCTNMNEILIYEVFIFHALSHGLKLLVCSAKSEDISSLLSHMCTLWLSQEDEKCGGETCGKC